MTLNELSLTNYKNISEATLRFSDKLNCIIGANGMGKTNLLDSIYFLSFTRTHEFLPESLIIKHNEDMAIVSGSYSLLGKHEQVFIGLQKGRGKVLKRNKKEYPKISDHIGLIPLVMIAPSDIELIKGGSTERRNFIDQSICQESREFMTVAKSYRSLLEQRNKLLKQEMGLDLSLVEVLNMQMAPLAEKITQERCNWLNRLAPIFLHYYNTITSEKEEVALSYITSIGHLDPKAEDFIKAWNEGLAGDIACRFTRIGPHRDDLEMLLNGFLVRKLGSQGQNKSYMIALKLAQYSMLCQINSSNLPILLLDDVFDKLDESRVEMIVDLVGGDQFGQIFMSDTNRKYLDKILQRQPQGLYSIFRAVDGTFSDITNNEEVFN